MLVKVLVEEFDFQMSQCMISVKWSGHTLLPFRPLVGPVTAFQVKNILHAFV